MKKSIEDFAGPIKSDLELMWFITNLYLEQDRHEYKAEIENVIRITHDLVLDKIESNEIDPDLYSIVTALKTYNLDYFKGINTDLIDRPKIETLRSMLSTLRHTPSLK